MSRDSGHCWPSYAHFGSIIVLQWKTPNVGGFTLITCWLWHWLVFNTYLKFKVGALHNVQVHWLTRLHGWWSAHCCSVRTETKSPEPRREDANAYATRTESFTGELDRNHWGRKKPHTATVDSSSSSALHLIHRFIGLSVTGSISFIIMHFAAAMCG